MPESEPRSRARMLIGIDVEYVCAGRRAQSKGTLLGVDALLLQTSEPVPENMEVELRFRPTPQSPLVRARGVIARQVPGEGLRVRITDLAEEHRRHILELFHPPGLERRASKRVSLVTQIRTVVGGRTLVGYSKNISTGGILIETETPAGKGTELVLRFKLKPEGEILEARAVVAYRMGDEGMGLRFVDLPGTLRQAIAAFVQEQEA